MSELDDYLDGAEGYLLEVFGAVERRGPHDDEVEPLIRDWPSLYHLSPYRWALLDCLDVPAGIDVLELGAGCGAVTTWLAQEGRRVTAVEGSALRAQVIRARCAGLDGVTVRQGDAVTLEGEEDADLVTLIGVLEYAPSFGAAAGRSPEDAARAMLATARRHVRPDGALVIAIENRLGLKYLAGHAEDHAGQPYVGVEGYHRHSPAITWSRTELVDLVRGAGFDDVEVLLPFPDYKLPQAIVNPAALDPRLRAAQWVPTPWEDPVRG
ncbi:MAG: class I SAM-dependent methyltransferase, partial [Solirubrobacterales bacterium]|nr:class I SAM-dependent methyltransferase [Solirubrobacterales bacterium]